MSYIEYKYLEELNYACRLSTDGDIEIPNETISNSLKELKSDYIYRSEEILGDEGLNNDLFVWKNTFVSIFILITSSTSRYNTVTTFLKKNSNKDQLLILDYRKETEKYDYKSLDGVRVLKRLITEQKIKEFNDYDNIISYFETMNIQYFIPSLIEHEYRSATKGLSKPLFDNIDFNSLRIHADKYQFKYITDTINNKQFSAELEECLNAYEREQFYICAAGLGGVIEHLLYLVLEKNNMLGKDFSDNPTYSDYVGRLGKPPIEIKRRQKNHIKSIFMIRNSISHYNQGFTGKESCTTLMSGIKDIFSNYYDKEFSVSND